MIAAIAVLFRSTFQPRQKLFVRRQFRPDEAWIESEHQVREARLAKCVLRAIVCRQNQMRHDCLSKWIRKQEPVERIGRRYPGATSDRVLRSARPARWMAAALGESVVTMNFVIARIHQGFVKTAP
jgi:hypothetical protein